MFPTNVFAAVNFIIVEKCNIYWPNSKAAGQRNKICSNSTELTETVESSDKITFYSNFIHY